MLGSDVEKHYLLILSKFIQQSQLPLNFVLDLNYNFEEKAQTESSNQEIFFIVELSLVPVYSTSDAHS